MLTKAQVKDIRSLAKHKYRLERRAFLAEGDKIAREWLSAQMSVESIVATESWLRQNNALARSHPEAAVHIVSESELQELSSLQTANNALLVVPMPSPPVNLPAAEWCLALDTLQDPGNLGSVIRIADWFGIPHVVCSPGCADFYNPKVVQSAMGGHLRVSLHTAELAEFLSSITIPVFAATLGGEDIYSITKPDAAVIIIGNESKGIDPALIQLATRSVTIPRRGGAESLNAAVSAGILCALLHG